jgi:hypothetical protein
MGHSLPAMILGLLLTNVVIFALDIAGHHVRRLARRRNSPK